MVKLCPPAFYTIVTEAVLKTYLLITGKLGYFTAVWGVFATALWILFLQFLYYTLKWRIITWILFWMMIIVYLGALVLHLYQLYEKIPNPDNPTFNPQKKIRLEKDDGRNRRKNVQRDPEEDVPRNPKKDVPPNPKKDVPPNPAISTPKALPNPLPESFYF